MSATVTVQIPNALKKGTPAPTRVVSPAKLRSAKLPFSQELARDVENLSISLNTLHSTIANTAQSISIPVSTPASSRTTMANTTFATTDTAIFADATSGALTVLLPATASDGETHTLKKIDGSSNPVTLGGNGHSIEGDPAFDLLFQNWSLTVMFDGTGTAWRAI